MSQAMLLVDQLKRVLKARDITYAQVAVMIGMSEASVKRMFASRNMTLERLDAICVAAGIEFNELTEHFDRDQSRLARLTAKQEQEVVGDPQLFLVALSALNLMRFDDMRAAYQLDDAEIVRLLARLDRIGFLQLLPNNRFRLNVSRTFSWIPNGPIMQAFKENVADFFASEFSQPEESLALLNARLSTASRLALVEKLKRVAREFSEAHYADAHLPLAEREPVSLLLATRTWHIKPMLPLMRKPPTHRK